MLDKAKKLILPSRRSDVPPFIVMDVMAAAAQVEAQGRHVVHMEVGQPFQPAPRTALDAARAALSGRIAYTEALGMPSLRARIARHYADTYGLDLDPARVVVTTGSSGGFILAFLSLFEAGDRVALANPGYPPYRHILTALGCEPVLIETSAATRHISSGVAFMRIGSPATTPRNQKYSMSKARCLINSIGAQSVGCTLRRRSASESPSRIPSTCARWARNLPSNTSVSVGACRSVMEYSFA